MESLRFLQLLQLVLPPLLDVKAENDEKNHEANAQQCENAFDDDLAGRDEQLNLPVRWLVEWRGNDEDLRVGDGLRPPAALLRQSNLDEVDKVRRPS